MAALKGGPGFISECAASQYALVHRAFRPLFQILISHCPLRDIQWDWIEIPGPANRRSRHRSPRRACLAAAVLAPAVPRECGPAVPPAAATHRASGSESAPLAADFPADLPAAVGSDCPASAAGFRVVRLASRPFRNLYPRVNGPNPAMFRREQLMRAATACCCGFCRPRCSRARACRRCSRSAIRFVTNAR